MNKFQEIVADFDIKSVLSLLKLDESIDPVLKDSLIFFSEKINVLKDILHSNSLSELTLYRQNILYNLISEIRIFLSSNDLNRTIRDKNKKGQLLSLIDDFLTNYEKTNIEIRAFGGNDFIREQQSNNRKIEKRYNQTQSTISEIDKMNTEIVSYYTNIKSTFHDLNEYKSRINDFNLFYQTNKTEIENLKYSFDAFFQNTEALKKTIDNSKDRIQETIDNLNQKVSTEVEIQKEKFFKMTQDIIVNNSKLNEENKRIQSEINVLLQGSNASRLAYIFESKKKQIEWQLVFWLLGVLVTSSLIVWISYYKLFDKITTLEILLERFLIIVPLLLLDIFFIYQYNLKNKIVEGYRFKSSIATSLFAFNELIKHNETDKSQEFVINSLIQIFESPFSDKDYENPAIKSLEASYKKVETRIDAILERLPIR